MRNDVLFSLFLGSGLLIAAISVITGNVKSLNVHDTYYVITAWNLSIMFIVIFGSQAVFYYFIRHHRKEILGLVQLISLFIPTLYFMFSDALEPKLDPANYPSFSYDFQAHYVPIAMGCLFAISILLLVWNVIYASIRFGSGARAIKR